MAKDLNSLFRKLDKIGEGEYVQDAINRTAAKIEGTAKDLAPVDTGVLRSSITSQIGDKEAIIGTNVEYAAAQEFGTYKTPAQPFLFPALEMHRDDIVEQLKEAIREALKNA